MEGPISHEELKSALYRAKNGKSPGSDGFSYEFYKVFFKDISWFLLRSINFAYEHGTLSPTQRYGIITLLPKGDKPRQFLKNWRPISLLNISYKLASACIAERMKSSLSSIIHENQKGFVPGRYIGENIRLMYDLLFLTEEIDVPGMFLLIDFEKAFDSVSHLFIQKVLQNFNFGPSVQKWVEVFYNKASASVLVNGFLSESFNVERGCRQGDGLSPYLFLLCAEVLGGMIRNNENIKGIVVDDIEFKVSQFADDTVLFLDGSANSMNSTFRTLEEFANISGLRVNIDKTQAVWIGSQKGNTNKICTDIHVKWVGPEDVFTALGIQFTTKLENMVKANYDDIMLSVNKLMYNWSRRNLTVLGRVTIVKSLILSKLTFLILTLPDPPDAFIKELSKSLYNFIWKGIDRVSRNQMIQDFKNGGVRMVDVSSYMQALKATWIRRLLKEGNSQWVKIFYKLTDIKNILDIEGGSFDILKLLHGSPKVNKFWSDVFTAWAEITKLHFPKCISDFLKSSLWYNNNIRLGKKTMYYRHWVKNGVNFVNDLVDEDGNFLSLDEFKRKYNIQTNFLEYAAVLNCVKKSCKDILNYNFDDINICSQCPFKPFNFEFLLLDNKGSRRLYDLLISSRKVVRHFVDKWQAVGDIRLNCKQWSNIYLIPYKCTLHTKLRWFQFRLIHRILGTNSFLAKIGKIESNLCTFCRSEEETLLHLFCTCPITLSFWDKVLTWIKNKLNLTLILDKQMQLFGILDYRMGALNIILLLCRYYIYRVKMQKSLPLLELFQKDVKSYFAVEKYIFIKNDEVTKFNRKWDNYSLLVIP